MHWDSWPMGVGNVACSRTCSSSTAASFTVWRGRRVSVFVNTVATVVRIRRVDIAPLPQPRLMLMVRFRRRAPLQQAQLECGLRFRVSLQLLSRPSERQQRHAGPRRYVGGHAFPIPRYLRQLAARLLDRHSACGVKHGVGWRVRVVVHVILAAVMDGELTVHDIMQGGQGL